MEGGAMEETGGARADQMEGGAREKTGKSWSRRSPMAAHGGADRGWSHGGGRADSSRGLTDGGGAGGGGAWGGDREPMSQGDAEDPEGQGGADGIGDWGRGGDPEGRGGAEATEDQGGTGGEGRRSLTELEGRRNEAQPEEWSPEAADGQRLTKAEPEGRAGGLMGHSGEEAARSHGGAAGSKGRSGVQDSEAGGGDNGSSSHDAVGDWQTRGDPTAQMVAWGWAEVLTGDSGGDGEDWCRGGGRVRLGGSSEWSEGFETVCAAHTPQGHSQHRECQRQGNDLRGRFRTGRQFRADRYF